MEPEMMIAEALLSSAPVNGPETATVQPLVRKKRLAVPALVLGIVSVLLILAYMAIVITVARIVTAVAPG